MKIKYSQSRLYLNLALGSIFVLSGVVNLMEGKNPYVFYLQLIVGLLLVFTYFFESYNQYLSIKDGKLTKNTLRKRSVRLNEIIQIKSYPQKIVLLTKEEKLTINPHLIKKDSLKTLQRELGALPIEQQKNPFRSHSPKTT